MMDIPPSRGDFFTTMSTGGVSTTTPIIGAGNNGVFTVPVDLFGVEQVCVHLRGEGAITELGLCLDFEPSSAPSIAPSTRPSTTPSMRPSLKPSEQPSSAPLPIDPVMAPVEPPMGTSPVTTALPAPTLAPQAISPAMSPAQAPVAPMASPVEPFPPTAAPVSQCTDIVVVDFETDGNGNPIQKGDYVGNEWSSLAGFTVEATATCGGYTPDSKARIFDTSDPGTNQQNGDPDLGSPNR